MTKNNSSDWTQTLGHNFRSLAKAALGFYENERKARPTREAREPLR